MRSLDSLSAAGEIPGRVGLLKIDAEGADADILRGAASIKADIAMVEFWGDLPDTLGPCPFELEELRALVEPLGPRRFLFVRHGPRHISVGRWDTADPVEGEWGNLVFMDDSLVEAAEAALPALDRALRNRNERTTAEQEGGRRAPRADWSSDRGGGSAARGDRAEDAARTAQGAARRRRTHPSAEPPPLKPLDDIE